MHELIIWLWPMCFGFVAVVVLIRRCINQSRRPMLVPVIHRRKELQEELASLVAQPVASSLLRTTSERMRRPVWDVSVLEACVSKAKAIKANEEKARVGPTLARST